MRVKSALIGYALARSLPLAAIGATWSFSALLGRYSGTLAATVIYALCLLLMRTRYLEECQLKRLPLSRIVPACLYALLSGIRTAGGAAGMLPTVLAGTIDSIIVAALSDFGVAGCAIGLLHIPAAAAGLFLGAEIPLSARAAAEIIEAACPAGLAIISSQRMNDPISAGGLTAGLALGILQNILL